jgi:hypothetical protein
MATLTAMAYRGAALGALLAITALGCETTWKRGIMAELRIDPACSAEETAAIHLAAKAWEAADPAFALPSADGPPNVLCRPASASPEADGAPDRGAIAWTDSEIRDASFGDPAEPIVYLYAHLAGSFRDVALHELGHALGASHVNTAGAVMLPHAAQQGSTITGPDIEAVWNGR